mmetsp:Transcript_41278/g.78898  ORF Transcript_41278/g.78898 Transcript_41278/m.78898 type:complete len:449 (-) Transcript_41278:291-1637(-)|eukprot:CAMPEP_0114250772 /NCGR_PEP_ID=MMETSP0058-20121206/14885_1 /TAXON_ID=36894 /ORGANISM="Pyramimonas parkeae, CCMP726" /LENGTH=448 /DNA_ID=CAMNT_0001364469 /DNA_START=72 /DNA_END=1418 /DNA_ORIENTATION=+
MGKTPAQEARAAAKKEGMSHDKMKQQAAAEAHKLKQLANKDVNFGKAKGAGMNTKAEIAKQRARDLLDPTTEIGKAAAREAKKKAKEELEFLLHKKGISVKQPPLEPGTDPKTVLCEFFRYNCCSKNMMTCKFSHDLQIARKVAEGKQRDIYERKKQEEEGMENWDQDTLEKCIQNKHGSETNQNNPTTIVCKYFLEAVEKKLYGWFWSCPDADSQGGCKYRHKLPEGYVMKSEMRDLLIEERLNRRTADDDLRDKLAALELKAQGQQRVELTPETYAQWRSGVVRRRKEAQQAAAEARAKKGTYTGKELLEKGMGGNMEDDDCAMDMNDFMQDLKEREAKQMKAMDEEAASLLSTAKARKDAGEMDVDEPPMLVPDELNEALPPLPTEGGQPATGEPDSTEQPPPQPASEEDDGLTPTQRKKLRKKQEQEAARKAQEEKKKAAEAGC